MDLKKSKTFSNLDPTKLDTILQDRPKSAKVNKYGHHTKRQSLLDKIKGRMGKIVKSNLDFYDIKQNQEKNLKAYLRVLKRDQSYKRKVQSKVFVNMLTNQHHGDVEKMRKKTEQQRKNYYKRSNFKKCVDFYFSIFNDLSFLIPILVNGVYIIKEIVDYLRLILQEGEVLKVEDADIITAFVEERKRGMEVNDKVMWCKGPDDATEVESEFYSSLIVI